MTKRIISGFNVVPLTIYEGQPPGTPVATVTIQMSSGLFSTSTGSLTITGLNASDFQPPRLNSSGTYTLLSSIVIPATWNPTIGLTATQNGVPSPYSAAPYSFAPTPLPPPLSNLGFEIPSQVDGASGYTYRPAGASWSFLSNSGIQKNGSAWQAPPASSGIQTAFLQVLNGVNGSFSQAFGITVPGSYVVAFQAALRVLQVGSPPQSFTVSIDGQIVGTFAPTNKNAFVSFSTSPVTLGIGSHTLRFAGTGTAIDSAVFIDAISLAPPVPFTLSAPAFTYIPYTDPTGHIWPLGDFPPNVPLGTPVFRVTSSRSDGQPFTGHFGFGPPNNDYGGAYSLVMNPDFSATGLVNPTGPGVGGVPSHEHVTVVPYP